jgi:hypothetical protein
MSKLVEVSEPELADLIRVSAGRVVAMALMRAGGARLDVEKSQWAVPLLAEWRGVAFKDGGGI